MLGGFLSRVQHLRIGLLGRSFLLLCFMLFFSIAAWLIVIFSSHESPYAQQLSEETRTIYTMVTDILDYSGKNVAIALEKINATPSVYITLQQPNDITQNHPQTALWHAFDKLIAPFAQANDIKIYGGVNGKPGFWFGFHHKHHAYWMQIKLTHPNISIIRQWFSWGIIALIIAFAGAILSAHYVNIPLRKMMKAAQSIALHQRIVPLPEEGPLEFLEINRALNRMSVELIETDNQRALMLAGISHDLRTPLTRLQLEISMLPIDETRMKEIEVDIQQIDHCIRQFIDYARVAQEKPKEVIPIQKELHEIVAQAQRFSKLQIETHFVGRETYVRMNKSDLHRLINNLINNANNYAYNPENPRLLIRYFIQGLNCVIEVEDFGKSMTEDKLKHIMKPFSRGEEARSNTTGTGLGLAIVKRLVNNADGELHVSLSATRGLIFHIELPITKNPPGLFDIQINSLDRG